MQPDQKDPKNVEIKDPVENIKGKVKQQTAGGRIQNESAPN